MQRSARKSDEPRTHRSRTDAFARPHMRSEGAANGTFTGPWTSPEMHDSPTASPHAAAASVGVTAQQAGGGMSLSFSGDRDSAAGGATGGARDDRLHSAESASSDGTEGDGYERPPQGASPGLQQRSAVLLGAPPSSEHSWIQTQLHGAQPSSADHVLATRLLEKLRQAEQAMVALRREREQYRAERDHRQAELGAAQAWGKGLQEENARLKQEAQEQQEENTRLKQELTEARAEADHHAELLRQQTEHHADALQVEKQQNEQLQAKLAQLGQERAEAEQAHAQRRSEMEAALTAAQSEAHREREALRTTHEREMHTLVTAHAEELGARTKAYADELKARQDELLRLTAEHEQKLAELDAKRPEQEAIMRQLREQSAQEQIVLREQAAEISRLRKDLEDCKAQHLLRDVEQERQAAAESSLRRQLEDLQANYDALAQSGGLTQAEVERLQGQFATYGSRLVRLQAQYDEEQRRHAITLDEYRRETARRQEQERIAAEQRTREMFERARRDAGLSPP
eukprot:COSAG06_NODE_1396_length_9589_cov_15.548204_8_plen_516_part_00